MDTNFGKLTATLQDTEINKISSLVEILNNNIKPAVKIREDDIHIRCMYIVSEELNSYGGKFPLEELHRIKDLIVDSPVLIGHKKDQLPIGRNFHAEVVFKNNSHWVKSYFYWLKSSENANDLQKNIDGGVIKECSIGFTFEMPQCSICGSDIRNCRHEPFGMYVKDGVSQSCFFYYNQIDKVLETSLVYRGAVQNTSISNELLTQNEDTQVCSVESLHSLDTLDNQSTYLLMPLYIGLDILCTTTQNSIEIQSFEKKPIPKHIIRKYFRAYPKNLTNHLGQLIGYRGKERCSSEELQKYIHGEKSIVRRVELRLFPSDNILKTDYKNIKVMRFKTVYKDEIDKFSKLIMTKDGVRIFPLHTIYPMHLGYLYNPLRVNHKTAVDKNSEYVLTYGGSQNAKLSIINEGTEVHFYIKRFNLKRMTEGKKFIAEKISVENSDLIKRTKYNSGKLNFISHINDSWQIVLDGFHHNMIFIQPITLNGKEQYLLYQSSQLE